MNKLQLLGLEKISGLDFSQELSEILEGIDLIKGTSIQTWIEKYETEKNIVINYEYKMEEDMGSLFCIAAGLPNTLFDEAVMEYGKIAREYGEEYKYILRGHLLAGALAQYAGIISEGFDLKYEVNTYNSIGLENFLKFSGNEFLGYKVGILQYFDDGLNKKKNHKINSMNLLLSALIDEGVIEYFDTENLKSEYNNISNEYRVTTGSKLNIDKISDTLIKIFNERFYKSKEEAEKLVDDNFNYRIIERKMTFIDRYLEYQKRIKEKKDIITNYIFCDNIAARLYRQIGSTYMVDRNMEKSDRSADDVYNLLKKMESEKVQKLIKSNDDLFKPFLLSKDGGNGNGAVNIHREKPEIGQITDRLSNDYLRALIKKIIKELKVLDEGLLREIFVGCQNDWQELQRVTEDRLQYSMKQKGLITEDELYFKSGILRKMPDLFNGLKEYYSLDRVVIEQLDKMPSSEIRELWNWKVSCDGIFLILGTETESEEDVIEYHSEINAFDNNLEEIKLELNAPSKNKIYGSNRKSTNYRVEYDKNYHYKEEDTYNFSSNQGVGATIISSYKDPGLKIKIDGSGISGEYGEKDRESVDTGERTVTLRDRYFGDNIILRNMKKKLGKIEGDLIYIYGPGKKDQLTIEGFVNGDYGIELKEKAKEVIDEKAPIRYTDYKIEIDPFEIIILEEFEVIKSINEHSRVKIRGVIREEKAVEYSRYCKREDPQLVLKYFFNDQEKHLFKGIIIYSDIEHSRQNVYLEIQAVSYSAILEREWQNRIYQNQGSTYQDMFNILQENNPDFNFIDDGMVKGQPFITEDYPVILQYRESDWDFILRMASYLDKPVFVNDIRDRSEKVDIMLGCHPASAVEMKNISGESVGDTGVKNIKYNYLKVRRFVHRYEEDIFEVGKKVRHRFKLWGKGEMESIVLKNRIYLEKGILYSDYVLVREEDINILNKERNIPIEGRSFRAEVVEVNRKHKAKVKFIDLEDDFEESKAHYFPIDRYYRDSYFAPEIGDIVDIYFKSKNERHAALKSCSTEGREDIENPPEEKVLARTPEGYTIVMSNGSIVVKGKNGKNIARVKGDEITYQLKKDGVDSEITIDSKRIRLRNKETEIVLDDKKTEINCKGTRVRLSNKGIEFM